MTDARHANLEEAARLIAQAQVLVDAALDDETNRLMRMPAWPRGGPREIRRYEETENAAQRLSYVFGHLDSALAELRGVRAIA